MAHKCPDGSHTKLIRQGPVGTIEGVTFSCPRCGWSNTAQRMHDDYERVLPFIKARLSGRA